VAWIIMPLADSRPYPPAEPRGGPPAPEPPSE
jgi:hypothetical protein